MLDHDLISACIKNDDDARKSFYERFFATLSNISNRYSKSKSQSKEILQTGYVHLFAELNTIKNANKIHLETWVTENFIKHAINFIRNIRSEYYVSSTVRVTDSNAKTYDLFVDSVLTDFQNVSYDILISSFQQLVPSQRLIFNLIAIEQYDLRRAAELLEASEQTVKANLEKAKYNLQKNIDKNSKSLKNQQHV